MNTLNRYTKEYYESILGKNISAIKLSGEIVVGVVTQVDHVAVTIEREDFKDCFYFADFCHISVIN